LEGFPTSSQVFRKAAGPASETAFRLPAAAVRRIFLEVSAEALESADRFLVALERAEEGPVAEAMVQPAEAAEPAAAQTATWVSQGVRQRPIQAEAVAAEAREATVPPRVAAAPQAATVEAVS
jgi:hypothetical protein